VYKTKIGYPGVADIPYPPTFFESWTPLVRGEFLPKQRGFYYDMDKGFKDHHFGEIGSSWQADLLKKVKKMSDHEIETFFSEYFQAVQSKLVEFQGR
jgi:hypothetical protein